MRFASIDVQKHPVALGRILPLNVLDMSNTERQWWRTGHYSLAMAEAGQGLPTPGNVYLSYWHWHFSIIYNPLTKFDRRHRPAPSACPVPYTTYYNHKGRNMPWGSPDACGMKAWGRDSRADMWLVTGTRWTQSIVICTDVSQYPIRREDSDQTPVDVSVELGL